MTVNFLTISNKQRKPGVPLELNLSAGASALPENVQKVLIVAQMLASGTSTPLKPVQIFEEGDAETLFGAGSIAHIMAKAALAANTYIQLFVQPIQDAAASVKASGQIAITGPAGSSGTLTLNIGATQIEVDIAQGDTAATIETNLMAAINNISALPVTAAAAETGTAIVLTAKNAGTLGNVIPLSYTTTVSAVALTITAMSGGATDPDMVVALAPCAGQAYQLIVSPFNDATSLAALSSYLTSQNAASQEKWGLGIFGYAIGSLANACTLGGTLNNWMLSGFYLRGSASMPYEQAAVYAAVLAAEEDPAMPMNTVEMTGIAAPAISDMLSDTEQESCLYNGVTPGEVDSVGNVCIVRAITTYVKNANGDADDSLLDITVPRTLLYLAQAVFARMRAKFPQAKRVPKKTSNAVTTELLDILKTLEKDEIVENVSDNPPDAYDDPDNKSRIIMEIPADVVPGAHIIAGQIRLVL
jgi:phage tail sheath gpL-like